MEHKLKSPSGMKKFFRYNGLSLAMGFIFIICLIAQTTAGFKEYNNELTEDGGTPISLSAYLTLGHFIESTFENWESEFLQMAIFVVASACLFQKGSSESNDPDKPDSPEKLTRVRRKLPRWLQNDAGMFYIAILSALPFLYYLPCPL